MEPFNYRCPFCGQNVTITEVNHSVDNFQFHNGNKHGQQLLILSSTTCPNPECKEFSLRAALHDGQYVTGYGLAAGALKKEWQLVPQSNAKVLPAYIPPQIVNDYDEACAIMVLSPKASATLARRCLQGMIRDFWGISKARLIDEINALEDEVNPLTWSAIDSLRKFGNIGAHMERDIGVIVDVEPGEAELLIGLIEDLAQDWYVVKHDREQRLKRVVQASLDKEQQRKAGSAKGTTTVKEEPEADSEEVRLSLPQEEGG